MDLLEPVRIAVHATCRRPVRSALGATTAAVAIATVVTTMALIAGSRQVFERDLRSLGVLTVQVHADPVTALLGGPRALRDGDLDELIAAASPYAVDVVPARVLQFSARVPPGAPSLLPVVGTGPGYLAMHEGRLRSGRWLRATDAGTRVAVLDAQAAVLLVGREDAVGETVSLVRGRDTIDVEVVGVLEDPFSMRAHYEQFDTVRGARHVVARLLSFQNVYVPIDLVPGDTYTTILARAADRDGARALESSLAAWSDAREHPLFVWSRGAWIESVIEMVSDLSMLGGVLWGLVLLVAMVMIMAVTATSVRERYDEVAIRRTEGATRAAILIQFCVEGALLTGLGGLAGVVIGWGAAHVLADIVRWPPSFRPADVILAVGLGVLVGLGASALPARRAARLDPVAVLSRRRR